jgi:hypothetical protein
MGLKPGSPEWQARVMRIALEEVAQPEAFWYLSFAGETEFLGAVVVKARGFMLALMRANELGINPGGQVAGFPVAEGTENKLPHDRLLTLADLGDGAFRPADLGLSFRNVAGGVVVDQEEEDDAERAN